MSAAPQLSVLALRFQVRDERPDWPVVQILVDGGEPFVRVAAEWGGFDPAEILGPSSPLLPVDEGRRVAVYRCSCGEAGCGVIAPLVVASPDGRRVSWVDFRDYVGVFGEPLERSTGRARRGRQWNLPDLHFDRDQYVAEVERAARDDSWETPRRRTARLLRELLEPRRPVLPPDLELTWVVPAWDAEGVILSFQRVVRGPDADVRYELLQLRSEHDDPADAAADLADRLLSTDPAEWVARFGRGRT